MCPIRRGERAWRPSKPPAVGEKEEDEEEKKEDEDDEEEMEGKRRDEEDIHDRYLATLIAHRRISFVI